MSIVESIPLSLSETIGSLMTSLIDAQAQSARATVEFIQDIGTVEGATQLETLHQLRTVAFKYQKFDENFENKSFQVEVPLLGMVDIPLITVKNATFHFTYQITQTTKSESTPDSASSGIIKKAASDSILVGRTIRPLPIAKAATLIGKFKKVSTTSQATETGGLEVTIELEKAPLPIGLERILEMLENSAMESQLPEAGDNSANS